MLQIKGLDAHYGKAQALHAIELEVKEGDITALVGANGAGKSTLLRCISGITKSTIGSILFRGQHIERLEPHQIVRLGLIQVPEGRKLFSSLTVKENLDTGSMHTEAKTKRDKSIEYVFALLPVLAQRRHQIAGTLSGGEQQMVAVGRALMGLPQLLIMDEPSIGLAPLVVKEIYRAIMSLHEQGRLTVFLVEQNLRASLRLAQWGYVLENGKIVLGGSSSSLLEDERTVNAYFGTLQDGKEPG